MKVTAVPIDPDRRKNAELSSTHDAGGLATFTAVRLPPSPLQSVPGRHHTVAASPPVRTNVWPGPIW